MRYSLLVGLAVVAIAMPKEVKAEEVFSIVVTGSAKNPTGVPLDKYNRITFYEDNMTLSSSLDESVVAVDLLYSLYKHVEFCYFDPSGVEDVSVDETWLVYDDMGRCLKIMSEENPTSFSVGVFTVNGNLVYADKFNELSIVTLSHLTPGLYIAVSTDSKIKTILKFIIK